ncbi:MAG: zinc ABC transporter substrate-binding protein [Pseudomonadota bacterium]
MHLLAFFIATLLPLAAVANPPRVVTDIAPVHSLVASVMHGVGAPQIILPPGASPHGYALRPSEARMLAQADVVIWVGEDFTPWLSTSIQSLAASAQRISLLDVKGTVLLQYRRADHIDRRHDHDDHEHASSETKLASEDNHNEHKHHDHEPNSSENKVGVPVEDQHDHGHQNNSTEVHAWLDPENAKTWLDAIASLLSELDPENRIAYEANALMTKQRIDEAASTLRSVLDPLRQKRFIVLHDAYHYFESRFGVQSVTAILPNDGAAASAGHVRSISRLLAEGDVSCVFVEPQMPAALAETLSEEHGVQTGTLDPLGDMLERGPGLYRQLLLNLGLGLRDCLSEPL